MRKNNKCLITGIACSLLFINILTVWADNKPIVSRIHTALQRAESQLAIELLNELRDSHGWELSFPGNSLFKLYIELCLNSSDITIDDTEGSLFLYSYEEIYGITSQRYIKTIKDVAYHYFDSGKYEFAIPLFRKFQELYLNSEYVSPRTYYDTMLSLAWSYYYTQKQQEAFLMFSKCSEFFCSRYGETNSSYTVALRGMAVCAGALNRDYLEILLRENNILRLKPGVQSLPYAINLDNIGTAYFKKNQYENALAYSKQALPIFENYLNDAVDSMHCAISCSNIAISLIELQRFEEANFYIDKGLHYRSNYKGLYACKAENELASGNPISALKLIDKYDGYEDFKSRCHLALSDTVSYWACQKALIREKRQTLSNNLLLMTEAERRDYLSSYRGKYFHIMFDVASRGNICSEDDICYNNLLLSKSILLSFNSTLWENIEKSNDRALRAKYFKWRMLQNNEKKEETDKSAEELERQIINSIKGINSYDEILNLKSDDVKQVLKHDEIAVEFYCSNDDVYATIIGKEKREKVMHLCSVLELEDIRHMELEDAILNGTLCDLIWTPIIEYASPVTIYFSPDGVLHQIPIEWLISKSGHAIFDSINFYRVSSTRELVFAQRKGGKKTSVGCKSALFGGLKYYFSENEATNSNNTNTTRDYSHYTSFEYLPATLNEIENVYSILANRRGFNIKKYSGSKGSESAFRQLSGTEVSHLHIATHGFYYSLYEYPNNYLERKQIENIALEHSGLIMSDAGLLHNNESSNNGILTASEISTLDFSNVNLVVLSACNTGLGQISADGVFGLQRGFKQANCQGILMSLWKVDDNETQLMMNDFYKYWDGNNCADALKSAVNVVRIRHKDEPSIWASFITLDSFY